MIIAPAVQGLLVVKVRGIYPSNRLLFGLTCWMMTYGTVLIAKKHEKSSEATRAIFTNCRCRFACLSCLLNIFLLPTEAFAPESHTV